MSTKKQSRKHRGLSLEQFTRFVRAVGIDGAYMAVCAVEEGKRAEEIMPLLQPYINRQAKKNRPCRTQAK